MKTWPSWRYRGTDWCSDDHTTLIITFCISALFSSPHGAESVASISATIRGKVAGRICDSGPSRFSDAAYS